MKWQLPAIILLAVGCGVLGVLWWTERGKVILPKDEHEVRADSLARVGQDFKELADTIAATADSLASRADAIVQQDTINLETYLNERKKLPSADAVRLKRTILWRNPRAE